MGSSPISGKALFFCCFGPPACTSPISGTREPQVIFSSFCAPRFARRRARDREPPTSLALDRLLLPLPRRLAPHASQELQRSSLAPSSPCVFLGRYYLRLPASPRISPYLPASPCISLHLPASSAARRSGWLLPISLYVSPCISLHLLVSPCISLTVPRREEAAALDAREPAAGLRHTQQEGRQGQLEARVSR